MNARRSCAWGGLRSEPVVLLNSERGASRGGGFGGPPARSLEAEVEDLGVFLAPVDLHLGSLLGGGDLLTEYVPEPSAVERFLEERAVPLRVELHEPNNLSENVPPDDLWLVFTPAEEARREATCDALDFAARDGAGEVEAARVHGLGLEFGARVTALAALRLLPRDEVGELGGRVAVMPVTHALHHALEHPELVRACLVAQARLEFPEGLGLLESDHVVVPGVGAPGVDEAAVKGVLDRVGVEVPLEH